MMLPTSSELFAMTLIMGGLTCQNFFLHEKSI